ncbi:hypothetical protein [Kitasatospora phosalacinea]|uniref:Uncharacterized protein n=1 Tax=Kitasatospora phosalacinea TaxID=2065 RepID=A0ABW6GFB5_9ACTN
MLPTNWERRVDTLYWEGVSAMPRGAFHGPADLPAVRRSLGFHQGAEAVLRDVLAQRPQDERAVEKLAALLYSTGRTLGLLDRHREAADVLAEAAELYLLPARLPEGRQLLVGDVWIRRARALGNLGASLSALRLVNKALAVYAVSGVQEPGHPRTADLARVLALAAEVVLVHGDPDQALTCARESLGRYRGLAPGRPLTTADESVGYIVTAMEVAVRVETVRRQWDTVAALDRLLVGSYPAGDPNRRKAAALQVAHLRLAGHRVAADHTPGVLLTGAETARAHEEATAALPVSLAEALRRVARRWPDSGAEALRTAVAEQESMSASARVPDHDRLDDHARAAAELAVLAADTDPVAACRIAVEAHLLLEVGCTRATGTGHRGSWLVQHATPWARCLEVAATTADSLYGRQGRGFTEDLRTSVDDLRNLLLTLPAHHSGEQARQVLDRATAILRTR